MLGCVAQHTCLTQESEQEVFPSDTAVALTTSLDIQSSAVAELSLATYLHAT
jgi:hypothetical protein